MGFPNFANKTFANGECPKVHWRKYSRLSSIGESHEGVLAKVQWTLANWQKSYGYIGESTVDSRQLVKVL